ncbi:hypothetical protein AAFF_G00107230 [Aldrovandia affinis]|uniref:Uncharacterized protein n=1 Tax=Aldrovandia affinis TaxID=143900 RepID=A0AAD7WXE1_9TELE|nr:hypothetical protein AAFF_G00107230 [Aldrovandia affinis]
MRRSHDPAGVSAGQAAGQGVPPAAALTFQQVSRQTGLGPRGPDKVRQDRVHVQSHVIMWQRCEDLLQSSQGEPAVQRQTMFRNERSASPFGPQQPTEPTELGRVLKRPPRRRVAAAAA